MAGKFYIAPMAGFLGDQGSGKTLSMIKITSLYAEQIEYDITFNFEINLKAYWEYCRDMGYTWLMSRILHNKIKYKPIEEDPETENGYKLSEWLEGGYRTIKILDEAGAYLNSRGYKGLSGEFLHQMTQARHDSSFLWWSAQFYDQADKQLRNLSASFIQCDGEQRPNHKLKNNELYKQHIYLFNARNYRAYVSKIRDKYTGIKHWFNTRRLAEFSWEGELSKEDKMIFKIYKSFGYRVDKIDVNYRTFEFNESNHKKQTYKTKYKIIEQEGAVNGEYLGKYNVCENLTNIENFCKKCENEVCTDTTDCEIKADLHKAIRKYIPDFEK